MLIENSVGVASLYDKRSLVMVMGWFTAAARRV